MSHVNFQIKPVVSLLIFFAGLVSIVVSCTQRNGNGDVDSVAAEAIVDSTEVIRKTFIKADVSDSIFLLQFYNALHGNLWVESWPLNARVQNWKGVTLNNDGRVVEINLPSNNLNGTLPQTLGNLPELRNLNLRDNPIKGSAFIVEDNEGYGTKYDFNSSISESNEVKLKDSIWYLYSDQPVPLYSSLKRDTIVKHISNAIVGESRAIIIEDDGITNPSAGTTVEDGLMGRYIKVSIPSLDVQGYLFSGFLIRLPPFGSLDPEIFSEELLLINSFEAKCCFKKEGSDFVPGTNEERNGSDWGYQFERGISLSGYSGYEWSGSTVSFDDSYFSFQEAFLFAREIFQQTFDRYGVTAFPARPMSFKPNDYTQVTVEFDGAEIQSIGIEEGDGCVQEWFIRREGNRILVGTSAGC